MIKPTIGRIVWYYPSATDLGAMQCNSGKEMPGVVCHVWSPNCVNLMVVDQSGKSHARTSVFLVQEGEAVPEAAGHATWMPYQVGQAKKAEAASVS